MNSLWRMLLIGSFIVGLSWFLSGLKLSPATETASTQITLRAGWIEYYPYQFTSMEGGMAHPDGLGFTLAETCFHRAGINLDYVAMPWEEQFTALDKGELDVIMLAISTPERLARANFSQPYADLKLASFYAVGRCPAPPEDLKELAKFCRQHKLRLGLTRGFVLPADIMPIIEEARRDKRLLEAERPEENCENVAQGQVDLAFLDELVGFSVVRARKWSTVVGYQPLQCRPNKVCFMLNRQSVTPDMVKKLNQALDDMTLDGTRRNLVRTYLYPRLLEVLTKHKFFRMMVISAGMFAALTGILIARREGYDWVGAMVLGACPAIGGGMLRDLVLARSPLGVMADPSTLLGVALVVVVVGIFFRLAPVVWRKGLEAMDPNQDQRLLFFDTLGLAAYTVTNVFLAMRHGCQPLWLWGPVLAVIQNGGGGALRDILLGRGGKIAVLKGVIYGEIAFVGALGLSYFFIFYSEIENYSEDYMVAVSLFTMLAVIVVRTLVIARGWRAPAY